MNKEELAEEHSFIKSLIFKAKTIVLISVRSLKNILYPIKKYHDKNQLVNLPVIAFSESKLWNSFDNKDNWILTAGKVENLRIASKKLNGLEVKANEVFSFWKHIGNPNIGKGYVIGREVREGCVIPTIAGGLCQISNALYDTALKANFTIVERHKHTKVIKGSLAEKDRDATVKWNYVDLRFKSNYDFRIEVELTADKLIVSFKSEDKNTIPVISSNFVTKPVSSINDCYSCGNIGCFKHPDRSAIKQEIATTAFILDDKWTEYDKYIQGIAKTSDTYVVSLKKNMFIKTNRYSWSKISGVTIKATTIQGIYRALQLRTASKGKQNVFELGLNLDAKIARAMVKLIPIDATHIVISQNLLPFIYKTGALGGRTFDVLMTRLPMREIHKRLNYAYSKYPNSLTLNDFRADESLIALENEALIKAKKIITPHSEIAKMFNDKVKKLSWDILSTNKTNVSKGKKILFPASAFGRKGAFEMRALAKELKLDLVVLGKNVEEENFWDGVSIERFNGSFDNIKLVAYPTYIEHQPRLILKAIENGIPVITTTAAGLGDFERVLVIDIGNYEKLKETVLKF